MQKSERPAEEIPQAEAPLEEEGGSFGAWLRRHRELREIRLEDIAESSKISMAYLRAFEEDRFEILPAKVFAKGFLRQYADYVGLDPQEVINFYLQARGEGEPEDEETTGQPPQRRALGLGWLALLVSLVLLGAFWYFSRDGAEGMPSAPESSAAEPSPAPSQPREAEPEESQESLAETQRPPEEPEVIHEEPPEPAVPLRVILDFSGECWVEARLDGGRKRIAELKVQGESLTLEAQEMVDLKVGDARVVEVQVNGLPYDLGERTGTSVRSVRIDLASLNSENFAAPAPEPQESSQERVNP